MAVAHPITFLCMASYFKGSEFMQECKRQGRYHARYFRDKLAMRAKAKDRGIRVPEFIQVLNHDNLKQFMKRIPAPWVLKPRSQSSAIGIKKIETAEQLWQIIETLGDQQSFNLYDDPEIVWRLNKRHHAGLIVRSDSWQRVNTLIGSYTERFRKDFHASMPVPDRPSD